MQVSVLDLVQKIENGELANILESVDKFRDGSVNLSFLPNNVFLQYKNQTLEIDFLKYKDCFESTHIFCAVDRAKEKFVKIYVNSEEQNFLEQKIVVIKD